MSINLGRAESFMAAHARVLDRRRFEAVTTGDDAARLSVLNGLEGYRNPDGGYGWGLEPDLRAPESQPGGALHAFEAMADAGPLTSPHATALLDWLDTVTLPDGGLPFALPVRDPAACAPFWIAADPTESSLQITAAVAAQAHRVARWDEAVRDHPWLGKVTRYCFDAIRRIDEIPFAYVLSFALQFLDVASDTHPEAHELLDHLGRFVPADGSLAVVGGAEGEAIHPLGYAPEPGRPVRRLLDPQAVSDDLDRVERGQRQDGGWVVDFTSYSAAASLEWRGHVTVGAVATLRLNGR
ncbi:prenyltransferase/squalene oxidase repeat-containing protein [Amycolatopsis samaneae]|uniref:Prenyltransferase n=1 Tax=Amycolatopsis samaneae TaxID=664691 RepID=A0ABW5GL53_9PSEU